jgi:hypothetical protein
MQRRGLHRIFFVLVLLPMLCVFPYLRGINNPNEFVRVFTVINLVENGSYRIDEPVQIWGWVNDMAKVPGKDGADHYFMVKGPGAVYMGLPGYFVFSKIVAPLLGKHYPSPRAKPVSNEEKLWWLRMATWSMRLAGSQLPCFLFLLWFERYLRSVSRDPVLRYLGVAAAGLGTNYLAYVHMFASHSQYAAFAFLGFALIERESRLARGDIAAIRPSRAALAGFCVSACVVLEYHALFLAIVLSLYALFALWSPVQALLRVVGLKRLTPLGASITLKSLFAFAAGGLSNVPHMMYFHWSAYGNPLTPGHKVIENQKFQAEHHQGLWGILWPTWDHVRALAIDPSFGFFGMSPVMWLGLLAIPLLLILPKGPAAHRAHTRAVTLAWATSMAVVFGVNAGFIEWRAGWTVGPRYLVVCAPFFAYGAVVALERIAQGGQIQRAIARGVGGGLTLASIVAIGTVGLVYDTLPENIGRPFAQFAWPMARAGFVPHHIGEWFGWTSTTLWYVTCAAMLLAPIVVALGPHPGDRTRETVIRFAAFFAALAIGLVPALTPPEDGSPMWVLHPSANFTSIWEPPGRDRITRLREQAERYGSRGIGPCLWWKVSDLEKSVNMEVDAARAAARAQGVPRESCRRF